jgi:hypothetical protein
MGWQGGILKDIGRLWHSLATHDRLNALGLAAVAFILVRRAHNRNQASSFLPHTRTSLWTRATGRSAFTSFQFAPNFRTKKAQSFQARFFGAKFLNFATCGVR